MQIKSRPVPLIARKDLHVTKVMFREQASVVIKDPVAVQYHQLRDDQWYLLTLLDGTRSLEQLNADIQRNFPTLSINEQDVQQLLLDLHDKSLVLGTRTGQGSAMIAKGAERRTQALLKVIQNPLFIQLPGLNPRWFLNIAETLFGWVFHRVTVCLAMMFSVMALLMMGYHYDEVQRQLPAFHQFFGWPNLIYLWITLSLTKLIHEFGHALACRRMGCECNAIGLAFMVMSPTMYCDASDSWMLSNKWQRIGIAAAGMYVEVLLGSVAILLWSSSGPGLFRNLCLNVFFISTVTTVIFNANPLIRFDGYYIFSDWIEIPNLREKASRLSQRLLAWSMGKTLPSDPALPQTGQFWFILFAMCSAVYRWIIVTGIFLTLYNSFKPYRLQSIGVTWAVLSIGMLIGTTIYSSWRTLATPTRQPVNIRRRVITLSLFAALISGVLLIPVPFIVSAPYVVQRTGAKTVFVATPGLIQTIHVQPGMHIEAGQAIATLTNADVEDRLRQARVERDVVQEKLRVAEISRDHHAVVQARQELESRVQIVGELESAAAQLILHAPIAGFVCVASHQPKPKLEYEKDRPSVWHRHPLDEVNVGAWMDSGTELCSIAPGPEFEAVLLIEQDYLPDVQADQRVRLAMDNAPGSVINSHVATVSRAAEVFAPAALSLKFGGTVATESDAAGRERLTARAYKIVAPLGSNVSGVQIGMRGKARITISKYSSGQWLWRYLRQTFHFRL